MVKKSEEHKQAISKGQKRRWDQLRDEWEDSNRELGLMGMPIVSLREYERGLAPKPPKPKYVMTDEHKAKLRKIAIDRKYANRLTPHQFKKKHFTAEDRKAAKEARRLKAAQNRSQMNYSLQFARETVVGLHGSTLLRSVTDHLGLLDRADRQDMLKVAYYLAELGFIEMPVSSVSLATRQKMSQSAKKRYKREHDRNRV